MAVMMPAVTVIMVVMLVVRIMIMMLVIMAVFMVVVMMPVASGIGFDAQSFLRSQVSVLSRGKDGRAGTGKSCTFLAGLPRFRP
jgi:hypothetical protein